MSKMAVAELRKPIQNTSSSVGGVLQRKCDKCRKKKPRLQSAACGPAPETLPAIVAEVLRSPGMSLDPEARAIMEPRFGRYFGNVPVSQFDPAWLNRLLINQPNDRFEQEAKNLANQELVPSYAANDCRSQSYVDLSTVRVHNDSQAAHSARALNAQAYTFGRHIVFDSGQYAPHTAVGQQLLAHELVHVFLANSHAYQPNIFRRVAGIDVAGILDYERLAREIHDAIAGFGTDEEAVYSALQRLQHEPAAISQLEAVYSNRYGESLEKAIRGDFSGAELEYALQLINRGRPTAAQAVALASSNAGQLQASARRIHEAVEGWGTDEEAIYSVLTPLQRNQTLIRQLSITYQNLFHEDLRERIVDEMSGSELDYALYLLGEERMETTNISLAEAARLFSALGQSTFLTSTGTIAPVPFHYPPDGCYDRAHVMAAILTQMGYASEKLFAVSRASSGIAGLHVATEYAADVPPHAQPAVTWWYHVAPVIRVSAGTQGESTEMVLDPSMMDRPVPINDWTGQMSGGTFSRLTLSQLESELQTHPGYRGMTVTYTASRQTYYPIETGEPPATSQGAELEHQRNRPTLTGYAMLALVHELAAAIRRVLRQVPVNAANIINAINAAHPLARSKLWELFPNLRQEVSDALDPADMERIERLIQQGENGWF